MQIPHIFDDKNNHVWRCWIRLKVNLQDYKLSLDATLHHCNNN